MNDTKTSNSVTVLWTIKIYLKKHSAGSDCLSKQHMKHKGDLPIMPERGSALSVCGSLCTCVYFRFNWTIASASQKVARGNLSWI